MDSAKKFEYHIVDHICTLSGEGKTVTKELNIVSYAGNRPKYDLRSWKTLPDGSRQQLKGLTLTADEMQALRDAIILLEPLRDPEPVKEKPRANRSRPIVNDIPDFPEPLINDIDFLRNDADFEDLTVDDLEDLEQFEAEIIRELREDG